MQALYRKYRPRCFAELYGQDVPVRILQNSLALGRISHSYLFTGPRGTGKTTTARIFAKAVNCLDLEESEPCCRCSLCKAVQRGRSLDVIEIDAASSGRIADIRELREMVKIAPVESRFKVYIIDEAHQITKDAWDAALKTIEEPPKHVIFIFATTDPTKMQPTVLSRCLRIDFRTISTRALRDSLRAICEAEDVRTDEYSLDLLAAAAQGSSRDSLSLLDQAIVLCKGRLRYKQVRRMLGLASMSVIEDLVAALLVGDKSRGLELLDEIMHSGTDPYAVRLELVRYLRAVLSERLSLDSDLAVPEDVLSRLLELPLKTQRLINQMRTMALVVEDMDSQYTLEGLFLLACDDAKQPITRSR